MHPAASSGYVLPTSSLIGGESAFWDGGRRPALETCARAGRLDDLADTLAKELAVLKAVFLKPNPQQLRTVKNLWRRTDALRREAHVVALHDNETEWKMPNKGIRVQSNRKCQKVRAVFRMSHHHKNALMIALGYAEVFGTDAEEVVKRLGRLAKKYARLADPTHVLAIYRVSWARHTINDAHNLGDTLEGANDRFDRDFHCGIGRALSGRKRARKSGRAAAASAAELLEAIALGAEYAHDLAIRDVWKSKTDGDSALREFCTSTQEVWKSATSRELPLPCTLWRQQCWSNAEVGVLNPLWVMLDVLGINIRQSAVDCLVRFANGYAVESAKLN